MIFEGPWHGRAWEARLYIMSREGMNDGCRAPDPETHLSGD